MKTLLAFVLVFILAITAQLTVAGPNDFVNGQFRYGRGYNPNDTNLDDWDYLTQFLGANMKLSGAALAVTKLCKANNIRCVYYAYITAFTARADANIWDCNDPDPTHTLTLCNRGAKYIRENRDKIIGLYSQITSDIANILGKDASPVFLMEDDYYQYYNDSRQEGGNLSGDYLRVFFDDMVDAIKTIMPNAIISWDISPWPSEKDFTKWWGFFANATYIDYIHTNGGQVYEIKKFF
jgi:hypothetical protein